MTSVRSTPPFRAEQVGSFLRPPELLGARAAKQQGKLDEARLRELEDRAILDVLKLQQEVGLDVFTDGEFRRGDFSGVLPEALEGFETRTITRPFRAEDGTIGHREMHWPVVVSKLKQRHRLTEREVPFLKQHSPGPFKVTMPSATQFTDPSYVQGITDQAYPSRGDLLRDLTEVVRAEIEALVQEGVRYVQVDAPRYTYYVDPSLREHLQSTGVNPDTALDEAIAADNRCFAGARGKDVYLAMHLCRGNAMGRWYAEGGYDPIAEKLFSSLQIDALLLEYDSARAGGFEPLRFVPRDKTVVLGLVSTKIDQVESADQILRRIDEASKYLPLENLAVSPQCGFASVAQGNPITFDAQRRKLELVAEAARKVWS